MMQRNGEAMSSLLYIEDDSLNWEIVNMFLKGRFLVDTVADSSEALKKIESNSYSAILLDISLRKGISGLELAHEIRKVKNYESVPIIAVTALAFREDEKRILNSACTHYIAKPFTKSTLLETLKKALPQ
jgi:CheY-like chemotaxis protein